MSSKQVVPLYDEKQGLLCLMALILEATLWRFLGIRECRTVFVLHCKKMDSICVSDAVWCGLSDDAGVDFEQWA